MKKPYADSTLRIKYKQTEIEQEKINTVIIYLTACVSFYKLIELEDAWRVIGKKCKKFGDVSRNDFDALVPIFARDRHLAFYMKSEKELYADGKEKLLLIDKDYLLVLNETFSASDHAERIRCEENNEPYEGPLPMEEDWDRFYLLDEHQQGKELYIADDIIRYVDPEYIEETPQVEAMRRFLMSEVKLKIPTEMQRKLSTKKKTELMAQEEEAAKATILAIHRVICDISLSAGEAFPAVMKVMEGMGYHIDGLEQVKKCMELFMNLSNNTRMPCNRGFTPNELMKKTGRTRPGMSGMREAGNSVGFPQSMSFGPGIVNSIQNGTLDGNELKEMIIGHEQFPMELKANLLKEVDKAMKGVGKGDKPEKAINQAAGRNAPCPCGSGKKYKHCCGKLN